MPALQKLIFLFIHLYDPLAIALVGSSNTSIFEVETLTLSELLAPFPCGQCRSLSGSFVS